MRNILVLGLFYLAGNSVACRPFAVQPGGASAGSADTASELSRLAGWKGAAPNSPDTFHFAVLSDRTGNHVQGVLPQAIAQINLLQPDFVMFTGDFVEGFEKDLAGAEKEWDEIEAKLARLDAPFFYCLGNHDAPNAHYRQAYARLAAKSPTAGRPWYSFDYRRCHFVVFDSTATEREIPGLCEEQWAWLAKDLASAKDARHIFVFEHHPIFNDRGDWTRLRKLLHAGKTTIFSGHDHALSYAVEAGIPYIALGPTGGFGGTGDWTKGVCHQFAWVSVSNAQPRVAIIPVGHVLPHDLRTNRQAAARHRSAWWGAELSQITRNGGQTTLTLPNQSDVEVTYTLSWTGDEAWFAQGRPAEETVTIPPGKSIRRTYRLDGVADLGIDPPTLGLAYRFQAAGREEENGIGRTVPFARVMLEANRVATAQLGGRWQLTDAPEAWKGKEDCSAEIRIGYDDSNIYISMNVTDDVLFTRAAEAWRRDGVEVFWDPRGKGTQGTPFADPCRRVAVPLPEQAAPAVAEITPTKADPSPQVQTSCRRVEGGYVVQMAIPIRCIGNGFAVKPGARLRMDFVVNDRDEADPASAPQSRPADAATSRPATKPAAPKPAPTTTLTLSGYGKCGYRTHAYANVTFR